MYYLFANTLYFWLLFIWGLFVSLFNLCTLCICNVHFHALIEFIKTFFLQLNFLIANILYFWLLFIWGLLISLIRLCTLCICNVNVHAQIEFIKIFFNCTFYLLTLCTFHFYSFEASLHHLLACAHCAAVMCMCMHRLNLLKHFSIVLFIC